MSNELPIPPSARSDKEAREVVRAWVAHRGLHCSLDVDSWGNDPRTVWAILLTDVARHVADALQQTKGWDKNETVAEIRRVFNAELASPTAEPTGKFHTH